jgi:hypothetical protein
LFGLFAARRGRHRLGRALLAHHWPDAPIRRHFVHYDGPGGKIQRKDHETIGGTYFLKLAPKNVLLRDTFAVRLDPKNDGGTRSMRIGLWHASGDETRVPAYTADRERAEDDRLEVARFRVEPRGTY